MRGVVSQLTINGERMSVIIPGSVIDALPAFAEFLDRADEAGYLTELLPTAMPWARPLTGKELSEFASELRGAAASGDHAPERLAAVMRAWRETAEILGDPGAMEDLEESEAAVDRGDTIQGTEAVRALRARP